MYKKYSAGYDLTVLKRDYTIAEIPVIMRERQDGTSSITMKKFVYYMIKATLAVFMEALR